MIIICICVRCGIMRTVMDHLLVKQCSSTGKRLNIDNAINSTKNLTLRTCLKLGLGRIAITQTALTVSHKVRACYELEREVEVQFPRRNVQDENWTHMKTSGKAFAGCIVKTCPESLSASII